MADRSLALTCAKVFAPLLLLFLARAVFRLWQALKLRTKE